MQPSPTCIHKLALQTRSGTNHPSSQASKGEPANTNHYHWQPANQNPRLHLSLATLQWTLSARRLGGGAVAVVGAICRLLPFIVSGLAWSGCIHGRRQQQVKDQLIVSGHNPCWTTAAAIALVVSLSRAQHTNVYTQITRVPWRWFGEQLEWACLHTPSRANKC